MARILPLGQVGHEMQLTVLRCLRNLKSAMITVGITPQLERQLTLSGHVVDQQGRFPSAMNAQVRYIEHSGTPLTSRIRVASQKCRRSAAGPFSQAEPLDIHVPDTGIFNLHAKFACSETI